MTMIRPETEMKESGVQWIGDIPSDWNTKPLYACLDEINQKNNPVVTTNILSLTNTDGVIPYSERGNQGNKSKENFEEYKVVYPNTIVANSMNILIGSVGLSKYEGCVSPVYYVYMAKPQVDIRYMNYLFQMEPFQKRLRQFANGILEIRLRVSSHDILHQKVAVPAYDEQQVIADYLDETCSKIDEIIAEAKASIDEYKELKQSVIFEAVTKGLDKNVEMKDSGVEWIGEIPVDWNIAKINRVAWTTSGATPLRSKETEYYDNAVIRWVRTLDLNNGHVTDSSEKITETALKNSSCSIMPVKTVCVAMYGGSGTIGKSGILEVECATNQAICSIVSDKKVLNPDYLHYVIMAVRKYWMKYAVGTRKDPNINQQIIAQMRIPIPQLSKQDIIVNHLDKVTDKCDSLISEKESLINDLEAYKKSLIYEVVTGKRRVV